jgi:hypothetical protein
LVHKCKKEDSSRNDKKRWTRSIAIHNHEKTQTVSDIDSDSEKKSLDDASKSDT